MGFRILLNEAKQSGGGQSLIIDHPRCANQLNYIYVRTRVESDLAAESPAGSKYKYKHIFIARHLRGLCLTLMQQLKYVDY